MRRNRPKIDKNRYDYGSRLKQELPQVTYGLIQQFSQMYGEYLDNIAKPYPKELVEEARKKQLEKK